MQWSWGILSSLAVFIHLPVEVFTFWVGYMWICCCYSSHVFTVGQDLMYCGGLSKDSVLIWTNSEQAGREGSLGERGIGGHNRDKQPKITTMCTGSSFWKWFLQRQTQQLYKKGALEFDMLLCMTNFYTSVPVRICHSQCCYPWHIKGFSSPLYQFVS